VTEWFTKIERTLDPEGQVNSVAGGRFLPLVDSNTSDPPWRRPREVLPWWPYTSPPVQGWQYEARHRGDDRYAFATELRRAVGAVAIAEVADYWRLPKDEACLVAMGCLDRLAREVPILFSRIGRLAWNAGASWAEVGRQLGISKQAAWKRCPRRGRVPSTTTMGEIRQALDRLMRGGRSYKVSWETPLPPLESRRGALLGLNLLDGMLQQSNEELALLVAEARYLGVPWQIIGSVLGVSLQAAHKRYSRQIDPIIADADRDAARWLA